MSKGGHPMHSSVKKKYLCSQREDIYFLDILKARTFYNENVYLQKIKKEIGLERKSSFSVIFLSLEFNVWRKRG